MVQIWNSESVCLCISVWLRMEGMKNVPVCQYSSVPLIFPRGGIPFWILPSLTPLLGETGMCIMSIRLDFGTSLCSGSNQGLTVTVYETSGPAHFLLAMHIIKTK